MKKMFCLFLVVLGCLALDQRAIGQSRFYSINDNVSNFRLHGMVNYKNNTLRIEDFSGKWLILDFWNVNCSACIQSWPKLLEIQKHYSSQLQIVIVNPWQSNSIIANVVNRRKSLYTMDLPSSGGDSSVLRNFNIPAVPYLVWINPEGLIKYITYSSSLNLNNISDLLKDGIVSMPKFIANDSMIVPKFDKPLFIDLNGGRPKDVYAQSTLAKGDDRLWPGLGIESSREGGYYAIGSNQSIRSLYMLAYSNRLDVNNYIVPLPLNRISLEVSDVMRYIDFDGDNQVVRENLFVYQQISPPESAKNIQIKMQSDLNDFFGLNVHWVKRRMKCLVISAKDTAKISYKKGDKEFIVSDGIRLNKVSMSDVVRRLEEATKYYFSPYPILDETRYRGLLGDINIAPGFEDYSKFNASLSKYKMEIRLEDREIDVLSISDDKNADKVRRYFD